MSNIAKQSLQSTARYTAAFRLSSAVLEASAIPVRYRWSDDRIRIDLIEQDRRRARAAWVRALLARSLKRIRAALNRRAPTAAACQGATKTSVPG